MKKSLILAAAATMMTSCSFIQPLDGGTTGGSYQTSRHDNTPPTPKGEQHHVQPGSYQYGGNYQNGYQYGTSAGQHVTQNTGPQPGQHVTQQHNGNGYSNGGYDQKNQGHYDNNPDSRRPITGDIVPALPERGVREVTVNGEKLFLYNGNYYKPIRTNSGIAYKVVGTTQR